METEECLFKEIKQGKPEAIEALYNRYSPAFLSLCLRYCGNLSDAEDMLHDGFLKIIKYFHTFKKRSNGTFEGWMKRIIVNTALNFIRDRSKENRRLMTECHQEPTEEEGTDWLYDFPTEQISQEEILGLILALPQGYRTVFNLYVFEEYSHREIADHLHISENTSKSQLSKARALLRKEILKRKKRPTFA